MDEINRRIVTALEENARTPIAELGRKIGLSPASTADRVRRLEEDGIIAGYHALTNPSKLGYDVRAFLCVKAGREEFAKVIRLARSTPEVKKLHHTGGENSFVALVIARDKPDLERLVHSFSVHGKVETEIIVSTPVEKHTT
jgi:Lrp/AsnC family leucine-responsive transcriptional regulator